MTEKFKLSKTYEPGSFEAEISKAWLSSGSFHAVPDRREDRYVIMMPLPNITGALHMGHAMDNVMQDMLIRWHRMMGNNTLWMPGTDHAGIATQAVVEKRIKELEGLTRHDVGREGLVSRIHKWKDQFQSRIVGQQQRMGCSADWDRQRFTMDRVCSRAVRHAFFRMFADGFVFRGKRLVNWDPFLRTSISDDEVYHETVQGHFWHLRYPVIDPLPGDPEFVTVATTRPETMLGDTAVAVHPDPLAALEAEMAKIRDQLSKAPSKDRKALAGELKELERRRDEEMPHLLHMREMAASGRRVLLPLLDRPIPLVCDEWAKPWMGSGCVKITPAHDPNDYDVWVRHKSEIEIINILNPDGTLNENTGPYQGMDRFDARDRVIEDLVARGLMGQIEDRQIEIGHSDRSKTPIEPYLSDQWFIKMSDVEGGVIMGRGTSRAYRSPGLVQAAMDAASEGRVRFHPERFIKTFLDWLGEKRDWPISRQLWWGHRIPVWFKEVRFAEIEPAIRKMQEAFGPGWPSHAAIRVVDKASIASVKIDSTDDVSNVEQSEEGTYLVDVCLIEDGEHAEKLARMGFEQDPDVLDTWFSSALWPFSTLGWPDPGTADTEKTAPLGSVDGGQDCLSYYYPGSCLVTARDIITLWVARMVISGLYNLGDVPFTDVFIHANILDGKGERMSKSAGNGIDPVDIIEEYGADAMRYVLCDMQTGNQDIRLPVTAVCPGCDAHNDLATAKHGKSIFTFICGSCGAEFDVLGTMPDVPSAKLISERFLDGRKFCNKLWNTARFAFGHLESTTDAELAYEKLPVEDRWILASLNEAIRQVTRELADYNPSAALGAARDYMWGRLCDWYLELIKPRLIDPDDPSAPAARRILAHCFDRTLRLLHPFVPFITEHLYQSLDSLVPRRGLDGTTKDEPESSLLLTSAWPEPIPEYDDPGLVRTFVDLQTATTVVRELRSSYGVSPSSAVEVVLKPLPERADDVRAQAHVIKRLANISRLIVDAEAARPPGSASKVVNDLQIFVCGLVDDDEERSRLLKEMKRVEKELGICQKKLSNEAFMSKAPAEVVQEQRDRLSRYERQKQALETALDALG